MPNVSKHPADAEKLDPQEQLKKLRESLLRDAEVRPGGAGDEGQTEALSKKEAAARRFAGAGGGTAARSAVGTASPAGAKARAAGPVSLPRGPQVSAASAQQDKPGAGAEDTAHHAKSRSGERHSNPDVPRRAPSRPEAKRARVDEATKSARSAEPLNAKPSPTRAPDDSNPAGRRTTESARDGSATKTVRSDVDVSTRDRSASTGRPANERVSHLPRGERQRGQHAENRQPKRETPQATAKPLESRADRPPAQRGAQPATPQSTQRDKPRRDTPRERRIVEPNPIPPITFPEALPVSGRREEIARGDRSASGRDRQRRNRLRQDDAASEDLPLARTRPGRGRLRSDRPYAAAPDRGIGDGAAHRRRTRHAVRRSGRLQGALHRQPLARRIGQADDRRHPARRNADRPAARRLRHDHHRRGARAQSQYRFPARLSAARSCRAGPT